MSIPFHSSTQQLDKDHLDALQAPIVQAIHAGVAPAVALAILKDGQLLFDGAWGWLDPETETGEVTPAHYFDLASVTKLYTTVSLLALLTQKKLPLSTPLVDVLPEFGAVSPRTIDGGQDPHSKERQAVNPDFAGQTVNPAEVTLYHLLTHTSGLPAWRDVFNVAPAPVLPTEEDPISQDERWARAVDKLCNYPFVAPPDTGVRYSDIGLMLLGEAVARLAGESLEDAIREYVDKDVLFNPVWKGIALEQIIPTEIDATWRKRRVHGQVHDENACGIGGVAGHAGLFANARTVAQLGVRWLNRDFAISDDFYEEAVSLRAQTGRDVRGLGWVLRSPDNSSSGDYFSENSYGHTGFTGTSLWVDPERKLVVALLTNRVYAGREKVGIHPLRRAVHDGVVRAVDS